MSQNRVSLDGGREQIVLNASASPGTYLSQQFTVASKLTPQDTEWRSGGRPIYDRLPSASQRYKLNFSYDDNSAYPYIPPGEGYTGPTSMVVQSSGENRFLTIQAGKIVWKYGTLDTTPVIIDLEQVGIGSAKYLLAYQLYYDDAPQDFQYEVTDFQLVGQEMKIESGTDSVYGWRYTPQYSMLGRSDRMWSNRDSLFAGYSQDAYLNWQTPLPSTLYKITLRCPANSSYTGTASLYHLSCSDTNPSEYCNNPVWNFESTVDISEDSIGQYFEFNIDSPVTCKGWKVEWSDPAISINNIYVSGVVTQKRRPATATTNFALVAYPVNAIPSEFINSLGEPVPLVLCKLAYVDVDVSYTVQDIQDIREVVFTNYELTAEWLTRPWDDNLKDLFNQFSNFPKYWMNPASCMYQEYLSLSESGVQVIEDYCPSPPVEGL